VGSRHFFFFFFFFFNVEQHCSTVDTGKNKERKREERGSSGTISQQKI